MFSIVRQGDTDQYNIVSMIADTKADIASLPTTHDAGSTCFVIEDSSVVMLNTNKEWKEI